MSPSVITLPDTRDLRALTDDVLMQRARDFATARRLVDAGAADVAAELARRSDRSFGYAGLAQKVGARTPEKLVSNLTGVSVGEARSMVTVGGMKDSWASALTDAVAAGDLGVGSAAAVQAGLGEPNADIDAEALRAAAEQLAVDVAGKSPAEAGRAARFKRDELDTAGVVDREAALREKRYLRMYDLPDGSLKVDALFDPESAVFVKDAMDRVTMPRRGGPRFIDPAEQHREEAAADDTRTLEQVMLDAMVQFIRMAAEVDDGTVFGIKAPAVRMHVTMADVRDGEGAAYAEGNTAAFGMPTVHRFACAGGIIPVLFDDTGQGVNVGREFRTYTFRQRILIAARDGGCMAPGCDRPPSWTEVHHCDPWSEGGTTDLCNGISLCRHHHMWVHNTGRWITYTDGRFLLHSPDGTEPEPLESKHPLHARKRREPTPVLTG